MSRWAFPIAAFLNVGGVFLYAMSDWGLSAIFILFVGTALLIVCSFFDRRRWPIAQRRAPGVLCWIISGISFSLLVSIGNYMREMIGLALAGELRKHSIAQVK